MKDFLKIFMVLCGLVAAFLFGRSHGETTYRDGTEYRQVIKNNEELGFASGKLENLKIKIQNVTDTAGDKKTEQLLSELLQIFSSELDLQIPNREQILKRAAETAPAEVKTAKAAPERAAVEPAAPIKSKPRPWTATSLNKFKSYEWMITNSAGAPGAMRDLKKVQIRNIASFLKEAGDSRLSECEELLGSYKGSVKDINNRYFGSLEFKLKNSADGTSEDGLRGKISWYNNDSAFSENIQDSCGKKIEGLNSRIFMISADKYVQLYKLKSVDKTAGNFYEVLPNGTTKIIGSFVLNRVDRF